MNKKKLRIARNKIDLLDKKIFKLIKKRTQIVKYMLSLKRFKSQIVDRKRISKILNLNYFRFITKDTKDDKQFPYNINVDLDELEKNLNLY